MSTPDPSPPIPPVTGESPAPEVTIPEDAKYPCGDTESHPAHDWIDQIGVIDYEHYWCVGVDPQPVHLLNAYTWAGRRGECGITSEWLEAVHDRAEVTCPRCLEAITQPHPDVTTDSAQSASTDAGRAANAPGPYPSSALPSDGA